MALQKLNLMFIQKRLSLVGLLKILSILKLGKRLCLAGLVVVCQTQNVKIKLRSVGESVPLVQERMMGGYFIHVLVVN